MTLSLQVWEQQLLEALEDYFRIVDRLKSVEDKTERPSLRSYFERLDSLTLGAPTTIHPQLRHFLENKSYQKAYSFLQQR